MKYDETNPADIERYAKLLLGRTLRESVNVALPEVTTKSKGMFGNAVEKFYFEITPGNASEPDFPNAGPTGVELKSFPIDEQKSKRRVAGERISLGMINYHDLEGETWEKSSFIRKNALLLLVAYLRDIKGLRPVPLDYRDTKIVLANLWNYPGDDLKIIEDDWKKIQKKVKDGLAHEISEGDTLYLGAAPKAATGEMFTTQPQSDIKAKNRALTLKNSYVTTVVKRLLYPLPTTKDLEPAVKNVHEIKENETFEEFIIRKFEPFIGKSTMEIESMLDLILHPSAKNFAATLSRAILGVRKKRIEEFVKAGVEMKTIRLERDGMPKESMSFPAFKYKELVTQTWENSDLKNILEKRFFIVVFQKEISGRLVLRRVLFWTMPEDILEKDIKKVWNRTIELINEGRIDELLTANRSVVAHVRPHGRDGNDNDIAPNGKKYVKKSFWLNREFVAQIVR